MIRIKVPATLDTSSLAAFERSLADATSPAIVLEGHDGVFCRGLDLSVAADSDAREGTEAFVRCLLAIRQGPPAIALIDGEATGGGVGIAAACDRVVATPLASFGLSELLFGLTPAIIWPVLKERVSEPKLRWLALSAQRIDANTALDLGLVDEVISDMDAVESTIRGLDRASPEAVTILKSSAPERQALAAALRAGAQQTLERLTTPDVQRRLRAFLAGEAPWQVS